MNQLQLFTYAEKYPFNIILIDGNPHFVGKEICTALGYANHNKAMGDHCKGVAFRYPLQTAGGLQETRIINEPDMLRLIVNSKLPSAQEFERWVFETVLPSIRKNGSTWVHWQIATPTRYSVQITCGSSHAASAATTSRDSASSDVSTSASNCWSPPMVSIADCRASARTWSFET